MTTAAPPLVEIRVLSIRQPFVDWLLADGHSFRKWIENRSWTTKYRGRLYLHASRIEKKPTGPGLDHVAWMWDDCPGEMQVGAILGSVDLFDCVEEPVMTHCYDLLAKQTLRETTDRHREVMKHLPPLKGFGDGPHLWDWWAEQSAWLVREPQLLAVPIPTGGKLQLWKHQATEEELKTVK